MCHLSTEERRTFLDAYSQAHELPPEVSEGATRVQIVVPEFDSARRQAEAIETIEEMARRIIAIAEDAEG